MGEAGLGCRAAVVSPLPGLQLPGLRMLGAVGHRPAGAPRSQPGLGKRGLTGMGCVVCRALALGSSCHRLLQAPDLLQALSLPVLLCSAGMWLCPQGCRRQCGVVRMVL